MSCLFNSLQFFLQQKSIDIRQQICDYLEQNKPILDNMDTKEILNLEKKDYIEHMRKSSTWGGAIEIKAACNIWKLKIIVINLRDKKNKNIEFIPNKDINIEKTIKISWTGGHYEPIRK